MTAFSPALSALVEKRGFAPPTAMQFVLGVLREAIATGAIPEGQALNQVELAASLKLSRMPVREALRILEAEGWVEFSPHRGAVVATLSVADINEIFEIRFALEALALRKSIGVIDQRTLDMADAILQEMDDATDIGRWVDLNRRFHLALYPAAGPRLAKIIEEKYDSIDRYLRLELAEMHNAEESQEEHRAILAACRARDLDAAMAVLEPHIVEAGHELAAALTTRRGARS